MGTLARGQIGQRKGGRKYPLPKIITAIRKNRGMVPKAARSLGCKRDTIYRAAERHASVRQALEDEREVRLDQAEQALFKAIDAGEGWAVCFYLKCQGKRRGYVERQEIVSRGDGRVEHAVHFYLPDNGRDVVQAEATVVRQEPVAMPAQPVVQIALPSNGRPEARRG